MIHQGAFVEVSNATIINTAGTLMANCNVLKYRIVAKRWKRTNSVVPLVLAFVEWVRCVKSTNTVIWYMKMPPTFAYQNISRANRGQLFRRNVYVVISRATKERNANRLKAKKNAWKLAKRRRYPKNPAKIPNKEEHRTWWNISFYEHFIICCCSEFD